MDDTHKGLIAWFARNSVAANLLMIFILVGGFLTINTINKQMFPQVNINLISFSAPYPGAAPQEVEEGGYRPALQRSVQCARPADRGRHQDEEGSQEEGEQTETEGQGWDARHVW